MVRAIVLNSQDNVATLVDPGKQGDIVELAGVGKGKIPLAADIDYGHKIATRPIASGEAVLKYGVVIGKATDAITPGQHVHIHNVEALRGRGDTEAT